MSNLSFFLSQFDFYQGQEIFWNALTLIDSGYHEVFIWRYTSQGVKVSPHPHSMMVLRMSAAVSPLPPYAFSLFPKTSLHLCPQKYRSRIFIVSRPQCDAGLFGATASYTYPHLLATVTGEAPFT